MSCGLDMCNPGSITQRFALQGLCVMHFNDSDLVLFKNIGGYASFETNPFYSFISILIHENNSALKKNKNKPNQECCFLWYSLLSFHYY